MSLQYKYSDFIDLHGSGRISKEDAKRQTNTAKAILGKINNQPGIILADEVGMGKTFVALAVATSVHFQDRARRPVVVMIPPNLKEKWPRDFELFKNRCVKNNFSGNLKCQKAERAEDFLKLLDDPIERRKSIVFLTHGAMSRGLTNGWIKLFFIKCALYRRRDAPYYKKVLENSLGNLLRMPYVDRKNSDVWHRLLNNPAENWLNILQQNEIDPENDRNPETDDDPVPQSIIDIVPKLDLTSIYDAIKLIPYRRTKYFNSNLDYARNVIENKLKEKWKDCLSKIQITLPLLIMDEAHHLKNSYTVLASLFRVEEAENDGTMIGHDGTLANIFERMLFLTATPFQLGHEELCNVLERFSGISWGKNAPSCGFEGFRTDLIQLRRKLDQSQINATNLDKAWSKLSPEDLTTKNVRHVSEDEWWKEFNKNPEDGTLSAQHVFDGYKRTYGIMRETEKDLRKWVIRHNKSNYLPGIDNKIQRRLRIIGNCINEESPEQKVDTGIPVKDEALLPFLLSARLTALTPSSRPVFAEGLSSSYEAFMQTRLLRIKDKKESVTDFDDEMINKVDGTSNSDWYLNELAMLLKKGRSSTKSDHPKIIATVNKVINLWLTGEKILVFCHYIATGKALRNYISEALEKIICHEGARKLKCRTEEVMDELEKIGKRFLSEETVIRRAVDEELNKIIRNYPKLSEKKYIDDLTDIIRRYLRTPSFLVRYFPLGAERMDDNTFVKALRTKDSSGLTLLDLINQFLFFLQERCEPEERDEYIKALNSIQPGGIKGKDLMSSYDEGEEEFKNQRSNLIIQPNVRLVNGSTKHETRQKLMLTFNTPFYPDILIASSVMAEGVDLQLNCRHVIHHDLCWNPSTLEQRTGRVDRIGAKSERCHNPIHVYIPFIAETQDEKMYKVVMDRERWFKVVMGEKYSFDAQTTEKLAERVPIPLSLAEELSFKLGVIK